MSGADLTYAVCSLLTVMSSGRKLDFTGISLDRGGHCDNGGTLPIHDWLEFLSQSISQWHRLSSETESPPVQ